MWEVLHSQEEMSRIHRITPTYVGSTNSYFLAIKTCKDHPHVCGKYG